MPTATITVDEALKARLTHLANQTGQEVDDFVEKGLRMNTFCAETPKTRPSMQLCATLVSTGVIELYDGVRYKTLYYGDHKFWTMARRYRRRH